MSEKAGKVTEHPGLGAIPGPKGVTFRVWAPHAETVYLTGTFNDWSQTSTPLTGEENGCWSTEVSEARAGDEYRYLIHGPKGPLSRIDPYARKVTSSIVMELSMILKPSIGVMTPFTWQRGMSWSFTRCTSAPLTSKRRDRRGHLKVPLKSFLTLRNWVSMPSK